jgi:hypothetical protein
VVDATDEEDTVAVAVVVVVAVVSFALLSFLRMRATKNPPPLVTLLGIKRAQLAICPLKREYTPTAGNMERFNAGGRARGGGTGGGRGGATPFVDFVG